MKELLYGFGILFAVSVAMSLFVSHIFFWIHLIEEKFVGKNTDIISAIMISITLFLFPVFGMLNIVLILKELTLDYRIRKADKKNTNFSKIPIPSRFLNNRGIN